MVQFASVTTSALQMTGQCSFHKCECKLTVTWRVLWFLMFYFSFPDLKNKKPSNILIYFHCLTNIQPAPWFALVCFVFWVYSISFWLLLQVRVMEEKMKLANMKTGESDSTLHRKYQELMCTIQGKEDLIDKLEAQLAKQVYILYREACRFHELDGFCNVYFKDTDYVSLQVSLSVASRSAVRLYPAQYKILFFRQNIHSASTASVFSLLEISPCA